jgi:hypothetical protein
MTKEKVRRRSSGSGVVGKSRNRKKKKKSLFLTEAVVSLFFSLSPFPHPCSFVPNFEGRKTPELSRAYHLHCDAGKTRGEKKTPFWKNPNG